MIDRTENCKNAGVQCCQKGLRKSSQISAKSSQKSSQTYNLATFLATFKNKQKKLFKTGSKPVLN